MTTEQSTTKDAELVLPKGAIKSVVQIRVLEPDMPDLFLYEERIDAEPDVESCCTATISASSSSSSSRRCSQLPTYATVSQLQHSYQINDESAQDTANRVTVQSREIIYVAPAERSPPIQNHTDLPIIYNLSPSLSGVEESNNNNNSPSLKNCNSDVLRIKSQSMSGNLPRCHSEHQPHNISQSSTNEFTASSLARNQKMCHSTVFTHKRVQPEKLSKNRPEHKSIARIQQEIMESREASSKQSVDTQPDSASTFSAISSTLPKRIDNLKVGIRVFQPDRTTKAILLDERLTAGQMCQILIRKNFCRPSVKLSIVEKVPKLKIEHCFEDHEIVLDNVLDWTTSSMNMIFFEEREDKFGLFLKPQQWLGPPLIPGVISSDADVEKILFDASGEMKALPPSPPSPQWQDYLYFRSKNHRRWRRCLCKINHQNLVTCNRRGELILVNLSNASYQLYTTTGGWSKDGSPTPFGFALKPTKFCTISKSCPQSGALSHSSISSSESSINKSASLATHTLPQSSVSFLTHGEIYFFCASSENALCKWVSIIKLATYGGILLDNYRLANSTMQSLNQFFKAILDQNVYEYTAAASQSTPNLSSTNTPKNHNNNTNEHLYTANKCIS